MIVRSALYVFFGFSLVLIPLVLVAAEWYVAPPPLGQDDNPGTEAEPFSMIQSGINAATDGDTVIVAEGTYVETIQFKGKDIVLRSTNSFNSAIVANTIIDGNHVGSVVTFVGTEGKGEHPCELSGFTIRNGGGVIGGAILGGTLDDRTHATIQHNVITVNSANWRGGGLAYCDGIVQNNTITGNSADDGGGLYYCHGMIRNNVITGNWAEWGGGLADCGGTIRNNTITGNWADNWPWHDSGGGGLYWCRGTIRNCIISGNTAPWGPQLYYSAVPTYSCIQDWLGGGEGNISLDPKFADSDGRLSPDSPCIDAGWNEGWMWDALDLDGQPRIVFGGSSLTVDMGAFEYHDPTLDTAPPYVEGCDPAAGATDVDITTNIIFHLKDDGNGVDKPGIVMTLDGFQVTPTITGMPTDYTVTYDPPSPLPYSQTVTVTIDARDRCSPGNVMAQVTYSFTTMVEPDTTPPVITLVGDDPLTLEVGTPYVEPGYTATDNYDGDVTANVIVTGNVDNNTLGTYTLHYNVSDSSGNPAEEKTRTVNVVDRTPPVITLLGDSPLTLEVGTPYVEPGYTATDNYDGDITASVRVTGSVDHTTPDNYALRYNVVDSSGNGAAYQVRTVNVIEFLPFDIVQIIESLGGTVQLTWNSRPFTVYTVWCCFDLEAGTWNQEAVVPSQGEATTWTDSDTVCPCKFYRIEIR